MSIHFEKAESDDSVEHKTICSSSREISSLDSLLEAFGLWHEKLRSNCSKLYNVFAFDIEITCWAARVTAVLPMYAGYSNMFCNRAVERESKREKASPCDKQNSDHWTFELLAIRHYELIYTMDLRWFMRDSRRGSWYFEPFRFLEANSLENFSKRGRNSNQFWQLPHKLFNLLQPKQFGFLEIYGRAWFRI